MKKEFTYNKYKVLLKETVNYKEEQNSEADNALVRQQLWMLEQELKERQADLEEQIKEQVTEAMTLAQREQEVIAEGENIKAKLKELPKLREDLAKAKEYYKNLNDQYLWRWSWRRENGLYIYGTLLLFIAALTHSLVVIIIFTIISLILDVRKRSKIGEYWEEYHG